MTTNSAGTTRLGLGLAAIQYDQFRACASAADRAGFEFVTVGDNPALLRDTYVSLAVLADATEHCRIGTAITNPVHRDTLVVASALSSVAELAPGRTFLGLGAGRARQPATVEQMRAHIVALRELWDQGETVHEGERITLAWDAQPVPIIVCASGPRTLALAGELGDGVIIESGVSPDAIEYANAAIAEGARVAGRDPAEIETWWYLKATIADTTESAVEMALAPLAGSGGLVLGGQPGARGVPEHLHDGVRRLRDGYDKSAHFRHDGDDPNKRLLDDDELRDYVFDRFGIVGTPADWRQRIATLSERGVDSLFLAALVPDLNKFIATVGDEVIGKSAH